MIASAAQAAAPAPAQADAHPQTTSLQSVRDFVQGFYDWYVHLAEKTEHGWPMEDALKNKRWPMSDAIVTALNADFDAQAKSPNDIVGIDMDPFLAAQDECFPYKVRNVTKTGDRYQVEVFGIGCSSPHSELPTVIAVIEDRKGMLSFVNFIYPGLDGTNLLSTLKELKVDREKGAKQPN